MRQFLPFGSFSGWCVGIPSVAVMQMQLQMDPVYGQNTAVTRDEQTGQGDPIHPWANEPTYRCVHASAFLQTPVGGGLQGVCAPDMRINMHTHKAVG